MAGLAIGLGGAALGLVAPGFPEFEPVPDGGGESQAACLQCGEVKPIAEFSADKASDEPRCKSCEAARGERNGINGRPRLLVAAG